MSEKGIEPIVDILLNDDVDRLTEFLIDYSSYDVIFPNPLTEIDRNELEYKLFKSSPSILSAASFYGSINCVQYLMSSGANPNFRDATMKTPMFYAIAGDQLECLEYLLFNGANEHERDNQGDTIIHYAVMLKKMDILVWLYAMQILTLSVRNDKGETPLHYAATDQNTEMVQFLCSGGADVNALNCKKATPLHYAALKPNLENIKILWESGADVEAKDNGGLQPYHWAEVMKLEKNMEFMIDHGAHVRSMMH